MTYLAALGSRPRTEVDTVVEMQNIGRVFGDSPPVVALNSVSLSVERGQFVAVVGKSGSGKSTLLNILGLMDRPTSGTYVLDGYETAQLSAAERAGLRGAQVGFVFQAFHLISSRSVTDNVAMAGMYSRRSRADRREVAVETLRKVGLGHRLTQSPSVLSGGERQRVAIARALASKPALLLADEPTGNLDSSTAAELLEVFHALHEEGVTIVMITHDEQVATCAQRQLQMIDGVLNA